MTLYRLATALLSVRRCHAAAVYNAMHMAAHGAQPPECDVRKYAYQWNMVGSVNIRGGVLK